MNNRIKHIYLSSFFLFFINLIFSQNCDIKSDTLYLVKIDIRSIDDYPIIMNGLCKKVDLENLSKTDELSFLSEFYKDAFFCPELIFGAMNIITNSCIDNKDFNRFSEKEIIKICTKINKRSIEKKIKLLNGKYVTINITKLIADFWVVEKAHKGVSKNSLEIDIEEINEIRYCYIPFKIKKIIKPDSISECSN